MLIALAVLSISMLGVFTLVNQSIDIEDYADKKKFLIQQGYERVLKKLNYPEKTFRKAEQVKGRSVKYEELKNKTILPDIDEIRIEITSGGLNSYYYILIKNE